MSNKRHAVLTSTYTSYPQNMSVLSQIISRVKKVIHRGNDTPLTCGFTQILDTSCIVQHGTRGRLRIAKASCLAILGILLLFPNGANAVTNGVTDHKQISIDSLKLYAHSRIVNYKQFQCFNALVTRESRWNVAARNGSHYGLGQMRSTHYRNLDGFRQIDGTIAYINHRYHSSCQAWAFHNKRGFY